MVRPNACEPFDDDMTLEFLREQLRITGYVFIPGRCFRRLLQELGASEEDLIAMENGTSQWTRYNSRSRRVLRSVHPGLEHASRPWSESPYLASVPPYVRRRPTQCNSSTR